MVEPSHHDEWIAQQLKAEADRHEPDLERIRQLIRQREGDQRVRRSAWLIPAAAATFVVLTAGAITAVYSTQSAGRPEAQVLGPARPGTDTLAPTSTTPDGSSPPPTASSVTAEPTVPATSGAPKPSSPPISVPPTTVAPRSEIELALTAAEAGQAVSLSDRAVDWIAAGSANATSTVRSKDGGQQISGPHETGSATSTAAAGPFALSWRGGLSEPSRAGSRTWRNVSGPADGPETGLIVRVPAGKQAATLMLYVGAEGADGQLRARFGSGKVTRARLKAVSGGGYVVSIRFHTDHSNDQLTVELIGGSGGSISFAAAALR